MRLAGAGLLLELLLILAFVPAPLVPSTASSRMDELLPGLASLDRLLQDRLAVLESWGRFRRLAIGGLQAGCLLALFLPYLAALRWLRDRADPAAGRVVLLFGVLYTATALCAPHVFSKDVFSYILYGRIMAVYGGNPYVDLPAKFPQDPYLPLTGWGEVPSFYGPLWTLTSVAISGLGGERIGLTALLFRLVPAAAALGTAVLVWSLLRRFCPERAALGTALWAWNPLVILEGAGSGHNDGLLGLLLVLSVAALVRRRVILGLLALASATLVKYSAAVLAPLYLVVLLRRARGPADRRAILVGVAAASALAVLSLLPFRAAGGTLAVGALVASTDRYQNSPAQLLFQQARAFLGDDRPLRGATDYTPQWMSTRAPTTLTRDRGTTPVGRLERGEVVLALTARRGSWRQVYDPAGRQVGYVPGSALRPATRPAGLSADPELAAYERGETGSEVATRTNLALNLAIRGTGWLIVLFAMAWLMRSAATPDDLLGGWLVLLMLVYGLVATWFYPWYLVWGLAVAALRPRGPLAWALVAWSAGVLLYYGLETLRVDATFGWLYRWRVVPMFLPPLLVLGWHYLMRRARSSAVPVPVREGSTA